MVVVVMVVAVVVLVMITNNVTIYMYFSVDGGVWQLK